MPTVKGALARIAGTITRVLTPENVISLTFDDGPNPEYTPRLLDTLDKHGAKGTFFVVGVQSERHPEIIKRMIDGGHAIGCHSWDHPSFPSISRSERRNQIKKWEKALSPYRTNLFRPPFGHQSLASYIDTRMCGYYPITYGHVIGDWLDDDGNELNRRLIENLKPGAIILLHDNLFQYLNKNYSDRSPTIEAVDMLLQNFKDTYQFVTVPELFHHGRIGRQLYLQPTDKDFVGKLHSSKSP